MVTKQQARRLEQLAEKIRETLYDEQEAEIQPPDWALIAALYSKIRRHDTRELLEAAIEYYNGADRTDTAAYFGDILNSLEQAEEEKDLDRIVKILSEKDRELNILRNIFGSMEADIWA